MTKLTTIKKPKTISQKERTLIMEEVEGLRLLLISDLVEDKPLPASEPILKPVFNNLERTLIKLKIFELIEKL